MDQIISQTILSNKYKKFQWNGTFVPYTFCELATSFIVLMPSSSLDDGFLFRDCKTAKKFIQYVR